jgi:hypothetical protein
MFSLATIERSEELTVSEWPAVHGKRCGYKYDFPELGQAGRGTDLQECLRERVVDCYPQADCQ